ncbi:cyclase family protein [Thalassococcus profundi]|uniref:Cyclase family protein n=1 Tax=Thalassococcus profundi TaxID=2282382 RepID=A0A369TRE1_9RHOB|nr:cyclase family protein [Thalassococcus profundi]RDD67803.1 cyclase family protein [Thalassococcus profundi]
MCDICVMNAVKDRMLSRRSFFRTAGLAGAGAALAGGLPSQTRAAAHSGMTDLTHTLSPDFPTFFGEPGVSTEQVYNFGEHGFNLQRHTVNEHTGTHIDAPLHFSADGASVDEIDIATLICPLVKIDIAARAAEDADTTLTPDDIQAWIDANGEIPDNACVALYSGWGEKAEGDGFRNFDGEAMHFPGFHVEAAQMLLETGAASIASDTLSLDPGTSADFAAHYAWLPQGRFGIECIANLDQLPASGATVFIGAPKMRGGTGGPARIIAMV